MRARRVAKMRVSLMMKLVLRLVMMGARSLMRVGRIGTSWRRRPRRRIRRVDLMMKSVGRRERGKGALIRPYLKFSSVFSFLVVRITSDCLMRKGGIRRVTRAK